MRLRMCFMITAPMAIRGSILSARVIWLPNWPLHICQCISGNEVCQLNPTVVIGRCWPNGIQICQNKLLLAYLRLFRCMVFIALWP